MFNLNFQGIAKSACNHRYIPDIPAHWRNSIKTTTNRLALSIHPVTAFWLLAGIASRFII
jgi:hypothetical protein